MTCGTNSLMSVFLSHAKTTAMAVVAAALTCALVSHISPDSTGTTSVSWRPICAGAFSAMVASSSARSRLTCHLPSPSDRIAGKTAPTPCVESALTSALAVRSASVDTGFILSAAAARMSARSATRNGSATVAQVSVILRMAQSAPARLLVAVFPTFASSALSLVITASTFCASAPEWSGRGGKAIASEGARPAGVGVRRALQAPLAHLGGHLLGHCGRGRLTVLRALSRCQLGKVNRRHSR